jgi:hypothetical protein
VLWSLGDSNPERDLAGYEIVWRDTTAPLWQHSISVGNVTRFTSPVSKDNVIFGIAPSIKTGTKAQPIIQLPASESSWRGPAVCRP